MKDSPLDPNSTTVRVGRDGDREDDVRAPALEIGVPRAIPVATDTRSQPEPKEQTSPADDETSPEEKGKPGEATDNSSEPNRTRLTVTVAALGRWNAQ